MAAGCSRQAAGKGRNTDGCFKEKTARRGGYPHPHGGHRRDVPRQKRASRRFPVGSGYARVSLLFGTERGSCASQVGGARPVCPLKGPLRARFVWCAGAPRLLPGGGNQKTAPRGRDAPGTPRYEGDPGRGYVDRLPRPGHLGCGGYGARCQAGRRVLPDLCGAGRRRNRGRPGVGGRDVRRP